MTRRAVAPLARDGARVDLAPIAGGEVRIDLHPQQPAGVGPARVERFLKVREPDRKLPALALLRPDGSRRCVRRGSGPASTLRRATRAQSPARNSVICQRPSMRAKMAR